VYSSVATDNNYFAGNLGLGTANPAAKLDVVGNIYCSNKIFVGAVDGATTAQIANYSLAVRGTAVMDRVKVKTYGGWPDFVFEEKYNLLPLPELEQFIKTNKHLPEVASAADVEKEGIDLGDNQKVLLKKVEELTLYLIEQNKKLALQGNEINNLKLQLSRLEKK